MAAVDPLRLYCCNLGRGVTKWAPQQSLKVQMFSSPVLLTCLPDVPVFNSPVCFVTVHDDIQGNSEIPGEWEEDPKPSEHPDLQFRDIELFADVCDSLHQLVQWYLVVVLLMCTFGMPVYSCFDEDILFWVVCFVLVCWIVVLVCFVHQGRWNQAGHCSFGWLLHRGVVQPYFAAWKNLYFCFSVLISFCTLW